MTSPGQPPPLPESEPALEKASRDMDEFKKENPDYLSAMYFMGDGGDSFDNSDKIRAFMSNVDSTRGFGDHLQRAVLLGDESERESLSDLFGEANTTVAPDFEALVASMMKSCGKDVQRYMKRLGGI